MSNVIQFPVDKDASDRIESSRMTLEEQAAELDLFEINRSQADICMELHDLFFYMANRDLSRIEAQYQVARLAKHLMRHWQLCEDLGGVE